MICSGMQAAPSRKEATQTVTRSGFLGTTSPRLRDQYGRNGPGTQGEQSYSPPTGVIHESIGVLPEGTGSWLKSLPALPESQALENAGARVREDVRHLPSFLCVFVLFPQMLFLNFIYLFLAVLGLLPRRLFSIAELRFLPEVASLTAEHRPQEPGLQWLRTGAQELQLLAFRV